MIEPYKLFAVVEGDFRDAQKLGRMSGHTCDYSVIPGGFHMVQNYANPMNPTKRLVTLRVQQAKNVVRVVAFV